MGLQFALDAVGDWAWCSGCKIRTAQMIKGRTYLVAAAFLLAVVEAGYQLSISQSRGPLVDLGATVTLTCTAFRDGFWKATDNVVWKKQQAPDDYVVLTTNSPDYATVVPFAPRYVANAEQAVPDTVAFQLIINNFQNSDAGTYQCLLVGENANQVSPQQTYLYTSLTASTNMTSTAQLTDGVYVYSFTQQQQTTTCDGFFYGTGVPQIQVIYSNYEITNDFRESVYSYLMGSTAGLKQAVQRLTYTATSSFYPSSDMSTPLLCKALNEKGVILNSSTISIRSQKKPSLLCTKQDPSTVVLGSTNVKITCSLADYSWTQNASVLSWTFAYNTGNGQLMNVTLMNDDKGYNRQAINDPMNPQLIIMTADDNAILYTNYVISLTHGGIPLATTTYKLKVDASQTRSEARSSTTTIQSMDALSRSIFVGILTSAVLKCITPQRMRVL